MSVIPKLGARHTLAVMGFFGILNVYFSRIDLSIAIVAMVGRETVNKANTNVSLCETRTEGNITANKSTPGEFDWGFASKGDLLGSYYYGYIITQIAGAYLSSKIGFKLTWGIASLGSSVLTLLIPLVAREGGLAALLAVRIMIGLFHGVAFPAMHAAWSVWAPPLERSQLVAAHISGASAGTCIIFPLGGLLAATYGWPAVFYFTGSCSLVWSVLWMIIVHDSPEIHPRICPKEREYIVREISAYQLDKISQNRDSETNLKQIESEAKEIENFNDTNSTEKSTPPTTTTTTSSSSSIDKTTTTTALATTAEKPIPWKAILTSPTVFAVTAAHFTSNWGNYQMNTLLPTYLDSVLQFNLAANGLLSSVPYILQALLCFFTGWVTDIIRSKNLLRTVTMRKINTTLGHLVPAITVVIAGYMGCNAEAAIIMFTISIGFNGMTVPGSKSNMLDFAPKYSGLIFAISNTIANISGFLAPMLTGHLLQSSNSIEQWQLAFWISAIIYMPGFILFLIFGTDKLMPWAE